MQAINVVPCVPGPSSTILSFGEQDPAVAQRTYLISGTTLDSAGNALGNCVVKLYRTSDDAYIAQAVSAANGIFLFSGVAVVGVQYYLVAYLPGSPDVEGTTLNTLAGA